MNGISLTDYSSDELKTIFTALGYYLIVGKGITPMEKEAIDQFRVKLCEAGAIVRESERVTDN